MMPLSVRTTPHLIVPSFSQRKASLPDVIIREVREPPRLPTPVLRTEPQVRVATLEEQIDLPTPVEVLSSKSSEAADAIPAAASIEETKQESPPPDPKPVEQVEEKPTRRQPKIPLQRPYRQED